MLGHDFSVPWRATKFENKVVGIPAKGLFVHAELIQPRKRDLLEERRMTPSLHSQASHRRNTTSLLLCTLLEAHDAVRG